MCVRVSACQCGAWPISLRVRMVCWVPETLPFYLGLLSTKRSSTLSGCQEITLEIFRFDSNPEPKTPNCQNAPIWSHCVCRFWAMHTRVYWNPARTHRSHRLLSSVSCPPPHPHVARRRRRGRRRRRAAVICVCTALPSFMSQSWGKFHGNLLSDSETSDVLLLLQIINIIAHPETRCGDRGPSTRAKYGSEHRASGRGRRAG